MTTTSERRTGAAIAVLAAIGSAIGLTAGYLSIPVGVGIAVVGILIGTGVARGKFSNPPDSTGQR